MTEETLFAAALEKSGAAERRAFLDGACGGDAALRGRIERLLAADERSRGILDRGPGDGPPPDGSTRDWDADAEPIAEGPGTVIGPYKLKEQIGEGGFGLVFVAEQQHPVRRKVALKVVKPGMDTREVVARFEAERQALALMDHPNIATVLDGGSTASGRPYFVMELVRGVPVTEYCDRRQLTPRQRLELFIPVCQAVQHAHQKGIIHRDLKPSNVLVTEHDGKPVPKVIDFGVAKALHRPLTDRSVYTRFAHMVGTPLYMSPEQAGLSGLDVDTRADVYALGVLLYELLTGTTPIERCRMARADDDEVRRLIREEEPDKPSTRLSRSGDTRVDVAARRRTDPGRLARLVRGELDWVVMKCLEKDRTRRYETASGLAGDVQRYLADEPVLACPPSAAYRVRKFLRRHRGPAVAAGLVLLALVGGVIGTTAGLVQAERARQTAEKRLDQIERGMEVLGLVFDDLDPRAEEKEGRPLRAILGDRLDRAAAALTGEAVGDPLIVARLQHRLGRSYLGLGHTQKAVALLAEAVATRRAHLGPEHRETLSSLEGLAIARQTAGQPAEAVALLEQVRDVVARTLGADDPATVSTQHNLGVAYRLAGRPADAVRELEAVRDALAHRPDDPHTLFVLDSLATAYATVGKPVEAVALFEQVLDVRRKRVGLDNVQTITSLNNLAQAYKMTYRMRDAVALLEEARDAAVRRLSADHPNTLTILSNLAAMYRAYGETAKSIALGEQVREALLMRVGGYHADTISAMDNLGMAYRTARQPEKALAHLRQAAVGLEKIGFVHPAADRIIDNVSRAHEQLQQYEQAEAWRRKWLAVVREKSGPNSAASAALLAGLGANLLKQDKSAEAESVLREALALLRQHRPQAWETAEAPALLGAALLGQQKYAEAEPLLVQGYQGMVQWERSHSDGHFGPSTAGPLTDALDRLVRLYDASGKPAEAAKWRTELDARRPKAAGPKQ